MMSKTEIMKFILGTKEHMTQVFAEDGTVMAGTLVSVQPLTALQVKTREKDGYNAVQFGSVPKKQKDGAKATTNKEGKAFRYVRESRTDVPEETKKGDTRDVDQFEVGDVLEISGTTKGKGFQGVVKRHGFAGGPRTHGQKHSEREPGSIGATGPQRVFKGVRMAGRMGGDMITVKNLTVLAVDKENGKLLISGAVPGRRGTLLEVRVKARKSKSTK